MSERLSTDRSEAVRRLFDELVEAGPEERAERLAAVGDAAVRREVAALLEAHDAAGDGTNEPIGALDELHALLAPPASRPDPHRLVGRRIRQYQLDAYLGGGGMGVVYRARDTTLGRDVALKFLPLHLSTSEEAKRRFIQEAKTASALDHPNIATVYEIGETEEGQLFIAMAYYAGETLKAKIARGPLPVDEAVDYAIQMAEGLQQAHAAGIVHRDVKPANIMLTDRGRLKILDFGLAKAHDVSLTQTGRTLGTVAYMSPEQARGETIDRRTDIWSLGVVLYEMLTGMRPFRGKHAQAVIYSILNEACPPLTLRENVVSTALERLVETALAKHAEDRYADMGDLLSDLHDLRRDINPSAKVPPTTVEPHQGTGRRATAGAHRWWKNSALIAAAFVISVFSVALSYFLSAQTQPADPVWNIKPLTSSVTYEGAPTWSPDGSMIAYHAIDGNADIFMMSRTGGQRIPLTDNPADDITPRWSPDGSQIAFISDRGSGATVFSVPPSGGPERKLAETGLSYLERFGTVLSAFGDRPWSPDGNQLLFPRVRPTGETAIWRVDVTTGEETPLTHPPAGSHDLAASWSFDRQSMVFQRNQGGLGSIWLMPADGDEPRLLLGDQHHNTSPTWSADNRRIVFVSNRAGHDNLWDIDVASGALRQLTTGPERLYYPSTSRNGALAYAEFRHQTDLYLLHTERGAEERVTFHRGDNFNAHFSPDGETVVYQSTRTGDHEIWRRNLDSQYDLNLTNHPAVDIKPDWSPDGTQVAFLSDREGAFHLWVMHANGNNVRRLTEQPISLASKSNIYSYSLNVRWSPDGEAIGFNAQGEKGRAFWKVDRDGTNARALLSGAHSFDWWRDSRHVVYNHVSTQELRIANLETGEEAVLYQGPLTEIFVSADGRSVAFCHAASHFSADIYRLRLQPPESPDGLPTPIGQPEKLTHGDGKWHVHNGAWSPDGQQIIYTRDKDEGDLYVIENYQ